jgi:hypothetical protein
LDIGSVVAGESLGLEASMPMGTTGCKPPATTGGSKPIHRGASQLGCCCLTDRASAAGPRARARANLRFHCLAIRRLAPERTAGPAPACRLHARVRPRRARALILPGQKPVIDSRHSRGALTARACPPSDAAPPSRHRSWNIVPRWCPPTCPLGVGGPCAPGLERPCAGRSRMGPLP